MIGPGTGIAPMRALLQERSHQKHVQHLDVGDNILYFGCKQRTSDYLYEDELMQFQKDGTLTKLHLAFSRDQAEKIYVQDLLAKHSKETFDLIECKGAYIYVCGGTKMGMDVTETITKIIAEESGDGLIKAKSYVDDLRADGRFVQELWSA
jgi:NADPH-ferrihemoprotein reductase